MTRPFERGSWSMLERTNFFVPDATVIVEMIVFVLVMVVVTKYVVPHLRRVVEARQRRIEKALTMATQLEREVADANGEADRIRRQARREARDILDRARTTHDYLIEKGRREG